MAILLDDITGDCEGILDEADPPEVIILTRVYRYEGNPDSPTFLPGTVLKRCPNGVQYARIGATLGDHCIPSLNDLNGHWAPWPRKEV